MNEVSGSKRNNVRSKPYTLLFQQVSFLPECAVSISVCIHTKFWSYFSPSRHSYFQTAETHWTSQHLRAVELGLESGSLYFHIARLPTLSNDGKRYPTINNEETSKVRNLSNPFPLYLPGVLPTFSLFKPRIYMFLTQRMSKSHNNEIPDNGVRFINWFLCNNLYNIQNTSHCLIRYRFFKSKVLLYTCLNIGL